VSRGPAAAPSQPCPRNAGSASHLAVPLVGLDRVLGVLFVSQEGAAYTDDDLRLLSVVASQIAAYLTACRLHERSRSSRSARSWAWIARSGWTWASSRG
jgi:GAF domain-containing protein